MADCGRGSSGVERRETESPKPVAALMGATLDITPPAKVSSAVAHPASLSSEAGDRPLFAALDLGTNNCRLLIARVTPDGLEVVDAFSRIVRLGSGVVTTGRLSEPAMERTLDALRVCARKLRRWRVAGLRCVATEACRRAVNGPEFIARIRREIGISIEIVTPEEEARLALDGCAALLQTASPRALVFDIGGGSTEISWVALADGREPDLLASHSVPLGVVGLAETFGPDAVGHAPYERMVTSVRDEIIAFDRQHGIAEAVARGEVQLLGSSGTVTTLGAILLDLPRYDRTLVDGAAFSRVSMLAISRQLAGLDPKARAQIPCIGRERADLVVAGCAILHAMLDLWPVERLRIADRGVREGILVNLARARAMPDSAIGPR